MREALAISKKALGSEHPSVAIRLNNLALFLINRVSRVVRQLIMLY